MAIPADELDAKKGVREGKKMGRLTLPSENANREGEGSSKRTLRHKAGRSLADEIREQITGLEA